MKSTISLLLGTASIINVSSAAVVTSTSAPTADIISSSTVGGIDTALIDEASNSNHARGQLFSLGLAGGTDTAFEISAVTIKKSNTQAYVNDTITLNIFEGTSAQWDTGTGHTTAGNGSDYYAGTTVTPLYSETFTLNGSFTNNHFVTFQLAAPVTVNESSDFGFFMTYDQVGGTQDRFRHRENGSGGGRLSITNTAHGFTAANSRKVVNYIQGVPVPEPSSLALIGLGSLGFLARRRK